jgi:flagellar hook-associated protein 1
MISTFHGLETARRGMSTQQAALYVTGHNIANANTPGYSRQRVNFEQTEKFPTGSINRPQIPGQIGTGVKAGSIQRIRESFLDIQYRGEHNKVGYYGSLSESLRKMEEVMNEPSDSGLHSTMEKFWNSLQDLASHTENTGARDVVAASGQMVADTLNYYYNSLTRIQNDIGHEINVKVKEANAILDKISSINAQIADVEPHGYLPNDLYDERDKLVDDLSKIINIKVTKVIPNNYGKPSDIAEGLYNIELAKKDGSPYLPPVQLISVTKGSGIIGTNHLRIKDEAATQDYETMEGLVTALEVGQDNGTWKAITDYSFGGELAGLIESYGYTDGTDDFGYYPTMVDQLNKMTYAFAKEFNTIHKQGYALGSATQSTDNFFVIDPPADIDANYDSSVNYAQLIKVNKDIINDPSLIAAALQPGGNSGDNENALLLASIKTKNFDNYLSKSADPNFPTDLTGNMDTYYSGIIGKLGVNSQAAAKDAANSTTLRDSVEYNRQSISAVSLDEEMTNMIKFQHAYNAAARNITVVDEMLDKIINGMGLVGR